jgi:hypothetical protein
VTAVTAMVASLGPARSARPEPLRAVFVLAWRGQCRWSAIV